MNSDEVEQLSLNDNYWDFFKELVKQGHVDENSHLRDLINLYFNNTSKCLKCNKGKIIKGREKDAYIMQCDDKCSWNIKFEPPRIVNLYAQLSKYQDLSNSHSEKLRLLIEKKQLDPAGDYQDAYKDNQKLLKLSNENIMKIQGILEKGKTALHKIIEEKSKLSHELFISYSKRTESYSKIKTMITEEKLSQIKKVFRNEGVPKVSEISRIAKVIDSSESDVRSWLEWLDASKKYIELQAKINLLDNELKDMDSRILYLNKNYPLNKGKIYDSVKDIKRITIKTKNEASELIKNTTTPSTVPRNKKLVKTKNSITK